MSIASVSLAYENVDIITYESLMNLQEYMYSNFDNVVRDNSGAIIVRIETVIGEVTDISDDEYVFDLWIKGNDCFHWVEKEVRGYYRKPFPEKPKYGQKIVYEITPQYNGFFDGGDVRSYSIEEENVDVKAIEKEYIEKNCTYFEDISGLEMDFSGRHSVILDTVVGTVSETPNSQYTDYVYDLWIKGTDGYHYTFQSNLIDYPIPFMPKYGQRIGFVLSYGIIHISSNFCKKAFIIEENVDVTAIENAYLTSEPSGIYSHLLEPFDPSLFTEISYKKILRDIEGYAGKPIVVEGIYFEDLGNGMGLLYDADRNYYHFCICQFSVKNEILDFKMLESDHIKLYGFIDDSLYTYSSWGKEKTAPSIIVRKIILLDED